MRPQEMMYTPIHLKLYRACGIDSISLYYAALPFNGFSNFIPPLTLAQRYNPLTLSYPGIEETMTLLPCYSVGDLADHLTLRRWVRQVRRQQLALEEPVDLLLLIDMDADDEFWVGFDVPLLKGRFSTVSGLRGLVENVAGLDYVRFTTPGEYLDHHETAGSISIGQDTADGSFDGLSSWAEKWSNHWLWTGVERARILELQAVRLQQGELPGDIACLLAESFEARLKVLSTTHFGMAAPVMNLTRERIGRDLVRRAVETAAEAFARLAPQPSSSRFSLLDYVRGVPSSVISYEAHPSTALVRLPLRETASETFAVCDQDGRPVPSAIVEAGSGRELWFVEHFDPGERKDYVIAADSPAAPSASPVKVAGRSLENERISIAFDDRGQVTSVRLDGEEFALGRFLRTAITYGGKQVELDAWERADSLALGVAGVKRHARLADAERRSCRPLPTRDRPGGRPSLRVCDHPRCLPADARPRLQPRPGPAARAGMGQRLAGVAAVRDQPNGSADSPEALCASGNTTTAITSAATTSTTVASRENAELDSVNNHITHGWVAVSDGERGVLVAQSADAASGLAFCPLRTRREDGLLRLRLNPFGTYWGRQYRYGTADTGLGNFLVTAFSASDHIKPYAPSYNGRRLEFGLLIAPYRGDCPPEDVRWAAEAFAYPYAVLNDDWFIAPPAHRGWDAAAGSSLQ